MAERIATFYTRLVERNERRVVAALLVTFWVALGWQAWHVGLTFDEPTRMLSSYLYWLNRPDLYPQDMPPLLKIVTGWIPRALRIPLFPGQPWWNRWTQDVASEILHRLDADRIQQLFYLMRLAASSFAVLTVLLIWHWGRLLFGKETALLLLLTAVLSPNVLAHGCLLDCDLAATFTYLWAAFCAWRFWGQPGRKNSLLLGLSVLLAALAKMSMLIVGPLAVLVVVARIIRGPRPIARWLPLALASVLLLPYLGTLAAYKFDARRLAAAELAEMQARGDVPRWFVRAETIFRFVPIPSDMQRGLRSLSGYQVYGAPGYFFGEARSSGHWAYYPAALALKTPIGLQALFLGGLLIVAGRILRRRAAAAEWFLLLPGLLYLALAMQSNLQLGVRLVLPSLAFGLLLGGFAIERGLASRRGKVGLAVLFAWLAGASASIYPQGIAYFNEWAGGPDRGWKYLLDSNLDWGQNLPELASYLRRHHLRRVKLYYFGFDVLERYAGEDLVDPQAPPWNPELVSETQLIPGPGVYAISATLLPGHIFGREFRDYFRAFRERQPDAKAGHSIFIYKVP